MKVKSLKEDSLLKKGYVYNVFAIREWSPGTIKYYISEELKKDYHFLPYDAKDFEIIDNQISKYWQFGFDNFNSFVIGPKEVFIVEDFWGKYFDSDTEVEKLIKNYYEIAKDELFNEYHLSDEEKQRRKEAGWEFVEDTE